MICGLVMRWFCRGDPIGKKRWKLAARLRRVSGAAAGVVRAEPHGARGADEARPPARRVSDPL